MSVYKNRAEKRPHFINSRNFDTDQVYETRLELDLHSGTHIDMPLHIIPGGASSDTYLPEHFILPALLLDFSGNADPAITETDLQGKEQELSGSGLNLSPDLAVLLKTKNSLKEQFDFNFTFLEVSGARYLAERQVALVGLDALGIERDQPGHQTHRALLEQGIWIVEGLRLFDPPQGLYTLVLAPLKISGVEALPARALLLPAKQEWLELKR